MTTETRTKPEIQKLESIKDLELLAEGDVVGAVLNGIEGNVLVLENEYETLTLLGRGDDKAIIEYYVAYWEVEVRDKKIVQKPTRGVDSTLWFEHNALQYVMKLDGAGL